MLELAGEWAGELPGLLAAPRDPDTIFIPWQGWSLATEDFLTTRMMELVVHGDDLAASVGLDTPTYPEAVIDARARPAHRCRRPPARARPP